MNEKRFNNIIANTFNIPKDQLCPQCQSRNIEQLALIDRELLFPFANEPTAHCKDCENFWIGFIDED